MCIRDSFTVTLNNNLNRVYAAGNTLAANRVIDGELDVTASLTVDADSAQALTEFNNWTAGTQRMLRIELQEERSFIETTFRPFVRLDIPGAWTAQNIGGSADGVRTYELSLQAIYSPALAAMLSVQAQCARTAAF